MAAATDAMLERIDQELAPQPDAMRGAVVDIEAIAGLLQEAKANKVSHPGLVALESKLRRRHKSVRGGISAM